MDTEVVISVIAACAALAGVLASISALTEKQRAERAFLTVLTRDAAATRLRELRCEIMEDGAISSFELQNLIGSLELLTNQLSREHKLLIECGLRQRSIRGRARYAAKLMNRAGIGSGSLPIAIP
jgi:hypothetical protein